MHFIIYVSVQIIHSEFARTHSLVYDWFGSRIHKKAHRKALELFFLFGLSIFFSKIFETCSQLLFWNLGFHAFVLDSSHMPFKSCFINMILPNPVPIGVTSILQYAQMISNCPPHTLPPVYSIRWNVVSYLVWLVLSPMILPIQVIHSSHLMKLKIPRDSSQTSMIFRKARVSALWTSCYFIR